MKIKILVLIILAFMAPMTANATLLGRVNAYYSQKSSVAVNDASKAYEEALKNLVLAKSNKIEKDIKDAQETVYAKFSDLELAKRKVFLASPENDLPLKNSLPRMT